MIVTGIDYYIGKADYARDTTFPVGPLSANHWLTDTR
jgi:hypothetical protein